MDEYTHNYIKRKTMTLMDDVMTDCRRLIDAMKTNSNLPYYVHIQSIILTLHLCKDLSCFFHFDSKKE